MAGEVAKQDPQLPVEFTTLMEWADRLRTLRVRANADTPQDATRARLQ